MATLYDTSIEFNGVDYGICGIDVGNSRVKIFHDDVMLYLPYDKDWKKNVQHHFRDHTTKRYLIGLSSVNPKQTNAIVKVLQRCPGHLILSAHILLMRNNGLLNFGLVENAGIDRLLGAIGAMTNVKPPLITIDCGTAVTINVVDAKKEFSGGVIFAGLSTQLVGLAKQTAAIPEMLYSVPEKHLGSNTKQTLMTGVTASVVGGCIRTVSSLISKEFGGAQVPIVVSGGESEVVIEGLQEAGFSCTYHQNMVTEGVLKLLAHATMHDIQDSIISKITH